MASTRKPNQPPDGIEGIGPLFSGDNNDPAKSARRLLDTIAICNNIASALSEFIQKYEDRLPKCAVANLQIIAEASKCIHLVGRQQTTKVSIVKSLLPAYQEVQRMQLEEEGEGRDTRVSPSMRKVKQFVGLCRDASTKRSRPSAEGERPVVECVPTPPKKKLRRSERCRVVSPVVKETMDIDSFSGRPLNGEKEWTKMALINFMIELKNCNKKANPFLKKIIASNTCPDYTSGTGPIYRLYTNWVKNNKIRGTVGRPKTMTVREAAECIKTGLKNCTLEGSSQFKLSHMLSEFEKKRKLQAELDGLDPETVKCGVTPRTAKTMMTAVAMLEDTSINFNTHKSINKTEARYRAEHSVMGAQAYAMTALTTSIKAGRRPPWMNDKRFRGKVPSRETLETIEWMQQLLGADEVYAILPDLLFSTDDTTLFAFEGCKDTGEWAWKLVDKSRGDTSVRSDYTVGDDLENGGGLRVRLTFTLSATGQFAPVLISVSGLTEEELSRERCPDGILATKLFGVGKGGSVMGNQVFSWLHFLRADKKDNAGEARESTLRISNKKFMT